MIVIKVALCISISDIRLEHLLRLELQMNEQNS